MKNVKSIKSIHDATLEGKVISFYAFRYESAGTSEMHTEGIIRTTIQF